MVKSVLGIVGGSGFYNLPGIENPHWEKVSSPWGEPSDEILFAEIDGLPFRFLPRHGRGHRISPTHINFRANIDALKRAGVTDLVSISACGSLKDQFAPGHFVLVDQFIDRTFAREKSFFGEGCVAHVSMAHPVSPLLVQARRAGGQGRGHRPYHGRHLPRHGGPAVLDARGILPLPQLGLRRDRHDQHAGGQARPRSRDLLRDRRHGHRLRLLARGGGARRRRRRARRHEGQHREGAAPRAQARRDLPARAPAVPHRLRHARSTSPSSRRPRRATPRCWQSSTPSPAACSARSKPL